MVPGGSSFSMVGLILLLLLSSMMIPDLRKSFSVFFFSLFPGKILGETENVKGKNGAKTRGDQVWQGI